MNQEEQNKLLRAYNEGSISADDRYRLERAALDDPFLFDALEGLRPKEKLDFNTINDRLKERVKNKEVKRRILWIPAVAASLLLIASVWWMNTEYAESKSELVQELPRPDVESKDITDNPSEEMTFDDEVKEGVNEKVIQPSNNELASQKVVKKDNARVSYQDIQTSAPITETKDLKNEERVMESAPVPLPSKEVQEVEIAMDVVDEEAEIDNEDYSSQGADFSDLSSVAKKRAKKSQIESSETKEQEGVIYRGQILDLDNVPIIGANVVIDDTYSAMTDFDGMFSIETDQEASEISVSYTGFEDYEAKFIEGKYDYKIVLKEGAVLNEVVVTGAGINAVATPEIGWDKFYQLVQQNKTNSSVARDNMVPFVQLEFDVDNEGKPQNFVLIQESKSGLFNQAVRIVLKAGKWTAGKGNVTIEL